MTFDPAYALHILPIILGGAATTLLATVLGMLAALVIGLVFALAQRGTMLRRPVRGIMAFLRGTPLLVQLYFLYYVLPRYGIEGGALATGIAGLGLQFGAYIAEVYRAGIDGIPRAQWEAAAALNLGPARTWISIILPQAIPRVLPPLGNYLIAMFKSTPYLAAITVNEMLGTALDEASESFRYLEPLLIVGALFMLASYAAALFTRSHTRWMPVR